MQSSLHQQNKYQRTKTYYFSKNLRKFANVVENLS